MAIAPTVVLIESTFMPCVALTIVSAMPIVRISPMAVLVASRLSWLCPACKVKNICRRICCDAQSSTLLEALCKISSSNDYTCKCLVWARSIAIW